MKKILGINFGGLQEKTVRLVQIMLLLMIALFAAVSYYQNKVLSEIVEETRQNQQNAITETSSNTMHVIVESSLVRTTSLEAEIADSDFAEVVSYIYMMQTMAQGLFENQDKIERAVVYPPDPSMEGTPTVQAICAEGVDITKSEYLGIVGHMGESLLAMFRNCPKLGACYIGLADGTHLCVDDHSSIRFDENGELIPFPVTERPWYQGAVEAGGLYFTGLEEDAFSKELCITCSAPVYYKGDVVGVVGTDIFLENMKDFIYAAEESSSFSFIVNKNGQVILAPENNSLFAIEAADTAEDLRNSDNEALSQLVTEALGGNTMLHEVTLDGKVYYMTGAPMPTVGWAVIMVVDKELTEQPTSIMLNRMDEINQGATAKFESGNSRISRNVIVMLLLILLLAFASAIVMSGRIVKPIQEMTRSIIDSSQTGKFFEMKDVYRTKDEIEVLAEAFDDLSKKTKQYIEHITKITQEKERISTELELARRIQADMMPYIYPAFPDRPEFDIYATMNPAKEVGGDFYDFFLIDEDHLGMVVADVSGKGVPAALFMMMSKILINNFAMMGGAPAKVLEQTNAAICQNNEDEMFITAWFGILQISTGVITASNAGHEYPLIKRAGGEFEVFKDKHGLVLGAFETMKYKNYEFTMQKGDILFLYTDGVPEATNSENELFGVKRLLNVMNKSNASGPVELLDTVREAVNEFVGDADQFDDLTMLGITLL